MGGGRLPWSLLINPFWHSHHPEPLTASSILWQGSASISVSLTIGHCHIQVQGAFKRTLGPTPGVPSKIPNAESQVRVPMPILSFILFYIPPRLLRASTVGCVPPCKLAPPSSSMVFPHPGYEICKVSREGVGSILRSIAWCLHFSLGAKESLCRVLSRRMT